MILPKSSFFARDVYVTDSDVDWGSESLFCRHLDPQGDFLDVGANIGYYSLYMAPVVRRVFSFEPDPRNYAPLEANAHSAGNIFIQKKALSSHMGAVQLELGGESSVSKLATDPGRPEGKTVTVEVTTLDAFARSQADLLVTGIKLDTEGHELPILRSGMETIRRDQPLVLTELMRWPGQGGDREFEDLSEFATALGYSLFAFTAHREGFIRRARFCLLRLNSPVVFASHPTKMIFLVPERLNTAFVGEADRLMGAS
jgi:FkbM family methyltransferase